MFVDVATFGEFREVVDEAGVNDAVGSGYSAAQALEIIERTAIYIRACRCKPEPRPFQISAARKIGGLARGSGEPGVRVR